MSARPADPPRRSAGIVLYRQLASGQQRPAEPTTEILLGHLGGPYWAKKDAGAWSIPKGEYDADEEPWDAARREYAEELGSAPPDGPRIDLGEVVQGNGKIVTAYALQGDLAVDTVRSNTFELEWPPRSGRRQTFPELDRAAWFTLADAPAKMIRGQEALLDRLRSALR